MTTSSNYIACFAEPILGREHCLGNGLTILVSARLLEDGLPYDRITHLDPWAETDTVDPKNPGLLLIEARDPDRAEEGTIAHCVIRLGKSFRNLRNSKFIMATDTTISWSRWWPWPGS